MTMNELRKTSNGRALEMVFKQFKLMGTVPCFVAREGVYGCLKNLTKNDKAVVLELMSYSISLIIYSMNETKVRIDLFAKDGGMAMAELDNGQIRSRCLEDFKGTEAGDLFIELYSRYFK